MSGLHIRWRRDQDGLPAPPAPFKATLASGERLDVFVWSMALVIVILALAVRLYNVNWDSGTHLHPDERHITIVASAIKLPSDPLEYFDTATSRLNPYNRPDGGSFVYGTFPLFLTKTTAVLFGHDDYDYINLVGRRLTALFDAATVLIVFLLARRLFGDLAGMIGAALYASAPLAIQHAHFLVVDPYLTFFAAAALYFCVRVAQVGERRDYALAGLAIGLGTACKLTALAMVPVLGLAALVQVWPAARDWIATRKLFGWRLNDEMLRPVAGLVVGLLVAFIAFRVAMPYAFETPNLNPLSWVNTNDAFIADTENQTRLLGGEVGFPPSVQWISRASYLYPLGAMVRYGMGPIFGLAGWLAAAYAAYRVVRYRESRFLLPLAFVAIYFGFMGRQFSLYMRYFLPLYPTLAVLAAGALTDLVRWARSHDRTVAIPSLRLSRTAEVVTAGVVGASVLLGIAYLTIYTRPMTRIDASYWMYDNLPARSVIAVEHWDETIPMRLPGSPDKQFQVLELPLYELDNLDKVTKVVSALDSSNYIVISSRRLVNSIPRNEVNYPLTSRYYDLLYGEQLGFRLAQSFTSYPSLFGIDYPDYKAEESWTSYDHPPVLLFEKTADYSSARINDLLLNGPFAVTGLTPAQADKHGLLLSHEDLLAQQSGGTFSDVFSSSGIAHSYPTLLWLLLVQASALAVTPLAMLLFRRLPDRGYLLAKPLGLLSLAYPVWLIVSLKAVDFERTTIFVWLIVLIAGGLTAFLLRRDEILGFVRVHWRLILFSEALFLLAFFFFRELRLENPDLSHNYRGGEKPMDLAYLTAVTRSTTLPPYDPWFAGGYINYYYLGQFFTATLSKLTTIPPEVTFNLAVPTYFAFALGAAFSVSYNLAAAGRAFLRRSPGFRPIPLWSPYAAGLLGVFLVSIAGNLDGVAQMSDRLALVSPWHMGTGLPLLPAVVNSIGGLWGVIVQGQSLPPFDFWRSSRMLPPTISITEFPYFSFLFADLHAHMMAIPFQLATLGTCLALVLGRRGERTSWREWLIVALLGLLTGSLRWLNSWDYPPFLLVALASVLISERRLEGGALEAMPRGIVKAFALVALSFLFYQPFLANYMAPVSGTIRSPETTPVLQYMAHFGFFVFAIGVWLVYLTVRALKPSPLVRAFGLAAKPASMGESVWLASTAIAAVLLLLALFMLVFDRYSTPVVLVPVLALVAYLAQRELRQRRPDAGLRVFLLTLLGLALGLSIGVDFVTINGDIQRMNTVFKFYLHVWVLFALVSSFAIWSLVFVYWRPVFQRPHLRFNLAAARTIAVALAALLIGVLLYPVFATQPRLDDRFVDTPPTLDGMAYMQNGVFSSDPHGPVDLKSDLEGIKWLRENVEGTPTIVEGRSDPYRWGGRYSIYTGLPAVVGWDWHQRQQRGELSYMVDQRNAQVDDFYRSTNVSTALQFIRKYNVHYVILGQVERLYYPVEGLQKFDSGLGGALDVVYQNAGVTIFQVKPELTATRSP